LLQFGVTFSVSNSIGVDASYQRVCVGSGVLAARIVADRMSLFMILPSQLLGVHWKVLGAAARPLGAGR
jgi:hypothetical protein